MRKAVSQLANKVRSQQRSGFKLLSTQSIKYNYMSLNKNISKMNLNNLPKYQFAKTHNVPEMGDSITEGSIQRFVKQAGEYVFQDETIAEIETDKVTVEIKSPQNGKIIKYFAEEGEDVEVGKPFFEIDETAEKPAGAAPGQSSASSEAPKQESQQSSAPQQQQQQQAPPQQQQQAYTPPPTPQKSQTPPPQQQQQQVKAPSAPSQPATRINPPASYVTRGERREKMSKMRQKIAQRLKESQNTYALLTTFQETDMSAVMEIRNKYQKDFQKKHGVKLGFMSFFIKAAAHGLQNQPILNAVIDGKEVVYRDYIDISVAVATPTGLMVPVLRNCENQSFADIEKNLIYLAEKGKNGQITLEDMAGGTFTISNGGVFGSMMGTPILNPPQSAILGMHAIINRPVVRNDKIVARPMMYLALTYDHRLIDGREAATFLKSLANEIEDPRRILLDL